MVACRSPRDDRSKTPPGPEGSNGIDRLGCRGQAGRLPPFTIPTKAQFYAYTPAGRHRITPSRQACGGRGDAIRAISGRASHHRGGVASWCLQRARVYARPNPARLPNCNRQCWRQSLSSARDRASSLQQVGHLVPPVPSPTQAPHPPGEAPAISACAGKCSYGPATKSPAQWPGFGAGMAGVRNRQSLDDQ